MIKLLSISILFILIIILLNNLRNRRQKSIYQKAAKKWDGIVEELRRRK